MRTMRWTLALTLALGAAAAGLQAGELGDKAAPLAIGEWIKGGPVDVTSGDKVYVVEFWATWCGPCRVSIPHLTKLQKHYGDKVVFIGISDEEAGKVKPFVEKMGDQMDYVVAIDKDRATTKAYSEAFGQDGIPHAFIVHKGQILTVDHPMTPTFEKALEAVVAGKFSIEDAKKAAAAEAELHKLANEYFELARSTGKEAEIAVIGEKLLAITPPNSDALNAIAWNILTAPGIQTKDTKFALRAAELANKATDGKDPGIIDTYALALFENGKKAEAIEQQKKAVELAKADEAYKPMVAELEERLEKYTKGAKE